MKNTSMLLAGLAATAFADSPAKIVARQSASASSSGPLPTVTRQGNAFFAGDERFYIRGVDYQPGGSGANSDPLADTSACTRDIKYFQQLGLNTIRVYEVDNTANHDECMSALAAAGIYLALDVNTPLYSLNRGSAGASYNPAYLQSIFATIDAFATYSNTLLFYSGNEVINDQMTTGAAPYVKAVTRDMKQYIQERGYRNIPVGYSAAAVAENQYLMAQYMDCGDSPASDFYAINNYDWCDPSSFQQAWSGDVTQYSNYSLPIFFSEYGCITGDRNFAETSVLYSTQMTGVFSGGLVYEYSEEGNGYGLVTISGNTVTPVGSQFSDLQNALSSTSNPSNGGGYREGNGTTQQCPPQSDNWDTSPFTSDQLPATPAGAEKYFRNGAGTGPGLSGAGSQDAPGGSTVTASSGAGSATTTYATQTAQRTATNTVTTGGGSQTSGGSAASGTTSGAATSVRVPAFEMAPVICGVVMLFSAMLGAAVFV